MQKVLDEYLVTYNHQAPSPRTRHERQDAHHCLQGRTAQYVTAKANRKEGEITAAEIRQPARSLTLPASGSCQMITVLIQALSAAGTALAFAEAFAAPADALLPESLPSWRT